MILRLEQLKHYPYAQGKQGIDFVSIGYTGNHNRVVNAVTGSGRRIVVGINHTQVIVDTSQSYYMSSQVIGETLTLGLRTRIGNSRHYDFFADKFVRATINFFEDNNNPVTAFLAHWEQNSVNYLEFKKNLNENMGISESATKTWSGRLFNSLGFEIVGNVKLDTTQHDNYIGVFFKKK